MTKEMTEIDTWSLLSEEERREADRLSSPISPADVCSVCGTELGYFRQGRVIQDLVPNEIDPGSYMVRRQGHIFLGFCPSCGAMRRTAVWGGEEEGEQW